MNGGGSGGGIGGVLGGIFGGGVVIRGGPVGDDHCDPRTTRRGHPIGGGSIYNRPGGYPLPGGGMTHFPITPMNPRR